MAFSSQNLKQIGLRVSALLFCFSAGLIARVPAIAAEDPRYGTTVIIPLKSNQILPAADLVYPVGSQQVINPDQALQLRKTKNLDLSTLDPDPTSDLWHPKAMTSAEGKALDAALPISENDRVEYLGVVGQVKGRLKFNVRTLPSAGSHASPQTVSLILSRTLHTTLARKELLRKLGYQIPAMKYLPHLRMHFPNAAAKKDFLESYIPDPEGAGAVATRWDVDFKPKEGEPANDSLEIPLQDIAAMDATPQFYNLALAAPTGNVPGTQLRRAQTLRLLRALALPYGVADISESIDLMHWDLGKIQNQAIRFELPDSGNFSPSLDDALWIARRMAKLQEKDFYEVVNNAYFPKPYGDLIAQKMMAKRDSILSLLNEKFTPLEFDPDFTSEPQIISGKVVLEHAVVPGYATHFVGEELSSPLDHLRYYVISETAANVMQNLLWQANQQIPALTIDSQSRIHYQKLTTQWLTSGLPQQTMVKAWAAPLIDGGVDLSRHVVLGNYLGTNNLIQLVDTFGFHVDVGMMVGFDYLPTLTFAQGLAQATISINFNHVKPLDDLEQSIKEPVNHLLVPWMLRRVSQILAKTGDLPNEPKDENGKVKTAAQIRSELANDLSQLRSFLGLHESLIMTESISGIQQGTVSEGISASKLVPLDASITLQGSANQLILSRIQFYRKDENTITVYKDKGQYAGYSFSFDLKVGSRVSFPVLSISTRGIKGTGASKIYSVNVSPDPVGNPGVYAASRALSEAFRTGSVESLDAQQKHSVVSARFQDRTSQLHFFHFVNRGLRTNSRFHIITPDGTEGDYLSFTDGKQRGKHYQLLATQVANFLVNLKLTNAVNIDTRAANNPGQSFLGSSRTRDAQFQSRVVTNKKDRGLKSALEDPFVAIQYRWEGWNITDEKIVKLVTDLSSKYGYKVYPDGFLNKTKTLKMYAVAFGINVYEPAIQHILAMSPEAEKAMESKYRSVHHCFLDVRPVCKAMRTFRASMRQYRKLVHQDREAAESADESIDDLDEASGDQLANSESTEAESLDEIKNADPVVKKSKLIFRIVSSLERFTTIDDFISVVGGLDHIFMSSKITGFRDHSEEPSSVINSSTLGRRPLVHADGVLNEVQAILGVESGEFQQKWMRDVL